MTRKILIAGAGGQLGKEFVARLSSEGSDFVAPPEGEFNITNPTAAENMIKTHRPSVFINCAAFNAVDAAEDDPGIAMLVNRDSVGYMAEACRKHGVFFVHYSTDYVFDGAKQNLYLEEDPPAPVNVYGKSKYEGEQRAAEVQDCLILRLSWVYGSGKQNFLYKLSQWAETNPVLKVSSDEASVPTYTEDIVTVTLRSLDRGLGGLYHLTNSGYASRYELARFYLKQRGLSNLVIPVPMDSFATRARRAPFLAMSNRKICADAAIEIPVWEDAVSRFVKKNV